MNSLRFAILAAAHGGDIGRWPLAEQADARAYLQRTPDALGILKVEAELDDVLGLWAVPGPGSALAASIATAVGRRQSRLRRLRIWLSGVGAAATLSGGVVAGMALATWRIPAPDYGIGGLYGIRVLGEPLDLGHPLPEAAP